MVATAPQLPPTDSLLNPTRSRGSATLGEIGRSKGEVAGSGSIVGEPKQPCVFGCFLGWELWRCAVPNSDSMLVE